MFKIQVYRKQKEKKNQFKPECSRWVAADGHCHHCINTFVNCQRIKLNTSNRVTDLIGPNFKCATESPPKINEKIKSEHTMTTFVDWCEAKVHPVPSKSVKSLYICP